MNSHRKALLQIFAILIALIFTETIIGKQSLSASSTVSTQAPDLELKSADVNKDGVVDVMDIALVARSYGSSPAAAGWNSDADLNGDNIIDVLDVAAVAKEFGKRLTQSETQVYTACGAFFSTFTDETANYLVSHFDGVATLFGTGMDMIKALNPNVIVLGYMDVMAMHSYYDDWAEVDAHEDWFLHDVNGHRLISEAYGWYAMDVGSPGWREHFAQSVKARLDARPSADGILVDDVWEWHDYSNDQFTVDASLIPPGIQQTWHSDMVGMIKYIRSAIDNKLLILNTDDWTGDYLKYADGMMFEHFIYNARQGWETGGDLYYQLKTLSDMSATGKIIVVTPTTFRPTTPTEKELVERIRLYGLASMLLAMNGPQVCYSFCSYNIVGNQTWGPEMDFEVGNPRSQAYKVADDLYGRDFDNVKVFVNFSGTQTYQVSIDKTYILAPHTAVIVPTH